MSDIIKCPKCHKEVEINIGNSISEDGEVFMCPNCQYKFRYVSE
jgi:DNA-directed RNA polymerase subunit RPC12/RpoP